jgi:hypothetical protein
MKLINTFISDKNDVPDYVALSLEQARHFNPEIEIYFICKYKQEFFDKLNIKWVDQESLAEGQTLKRFNQVCSFRRHGTPNTTYPSPDLFWHRTAERIFYILELMLRDTMDEVFHFENDVLIYHDLKGVEVSQNVIITPMSLTHTTFAFSYFPTPAKLFDLCSYFIMLLEHGEQNLLSFGYDHISEMSLLNMALRNNLVKCFPIFQNYNGFIYDPGSYGQYLGGTNNGHGAGFVDPSHYIGQKILLNEIHPVFDVKPYTEHNPIFNLHIHSKNLGQFICKTT